VQDVIESNISPKSNENNPRKTPQTPQITTLDKTTISRFVGKIFDGYKLVINKEGLSEVVEAISELCYDKAERISTEDLSAQWEHAADKINTLAEHIKNSGL